MNTGISTIFHPAVPEMMTCNQWSKAVATATTQAPWLKKHDQTKVRLDSQRPQAATNGHSIVLIGLQRDPCIRSIIPLTG